MKNKIANVLLVVLTILAVYQSGQLWFGSTSSHNFFYAFGTRFAESFNEEDKIGFVTPYRMLANLGNQQFIAKYNGLQRRTDKQAVDQILIQLLKTGQYVQTYDGLSEDMFRNRSYIYEYSFPMPSDLFTQCLADQKSALLTAYFQKFQSVIIVPSASDTEQIRVYFADDAGACHEFHVNVRSTLNESLNQELNYLEESAYGIFYLSSLQSGISIFDKPVFIPVWPGEAYEYEMVTVENPYAGSGGALLSTVESQLDRFFTDPSAKLYNGELNGVYTYRDENVVIKYFNNDVLEYSNYYVDYQTRSTELIQDYCTAVMFIREQDENVVNDFYLAGYQGQDSARTFYFDYAVNDKKLVLSPQLKMQLEGLEHFLEVTVENGRVTKYRKYACTFVVDENWTDFADIPFSDFVDSKFLYSDLSETPFSLTQIDLAYNVGGSGELSLYWFLEMDGNILADVAKKGKQVVR